jgi:hypothetical protein
VNGNGVELPFGQPIGTAEVDTICAIEDGVYRNRWITYGYFDTSGRLATVIENNTSGKAPVTHNVSGMRYERRGAKPSPQPTSAANPFG